MLVFRSKRVGESTEVIWLIFRKLIEFLYSADAKIGGQLHW